MDDNPYYPPTILTVKPTFNNQHPFFTTSMLPKHTKTTPKIMDTKITILTFFTLFIFTVSATRPIIAPPRPTASTVVTASSLNIHLPSEIIEPDANKTTIEHRKTTNDLTPRTNFSRFRPINRHFNDKPHRRPCRKHSQYRISRNGDFATRKGVGSRSGGFCGGVPTSWLKIKHRYDSRYRSTNCKHDDKVYKDNVVQTENAFDREKMKSLIREHEQMKKREEEAALMKNIRKFLKHTLD
ncbi:hypothetical protein CTI12_AA442410 [Artemisia annua]|uniref:Uncharacterized protein n=1 Tax=Artemisia annua TaxID=35608 RepID=A0A2U1LX83_ARTAN|nr:hypothetical protein CTI12_AA442410 [Artemisia annua]